MSSETRSGKILFVKTPATGFVGRQATLRNKLSAEVPLPLGLCYLAAVLREDGYEVEIFDPHIEHLDDFGASGDVDLLKRAIDDRLAEVDYAVVGVASQFLYTHRWGHFIADRAKAAAPEVPVIIGGGHPSLIWDKVIADANVDFVVIGEGEQTTLSIVRALEAGDRQALDVLDGLCYRRGDEVVCRPKISFITDVDALPFPAWDLIDLERYLAVSIRTISYGRRSLPLITSRGCPYSCTFCNSFESWGRRFRMRAPERILAEVDHLVSRFGVEDVYFVDDNMTVNKARMMELCAGLDAREVTWGVVNISSFTTDEPMLEAMKHSGCTNLSISIESAVPRVLEALRKPVNLDWSKELVRICRRLGLTCFLNFITGLPHETKEDMLATCRYAEEIESDWNTFSVLVPYPGTDIYRFCVERGYLDEASLDIDNLTQRNLQLETEAWDRQWVQQLTYDTNIRVNFLRNHNLVGEDAEHQDARLAWVCGMLEYIVSNHPQHAIGHLCLGYAYHRRGMDAESARALALVSELFEDAEVAETYAKYLEWEQERVIRFYREWQQQGG